MKKSILSLAIFSALFTTASAFADHCPNVVFKDGAYQINFNLSSFSLPILPLPSGLNSRYNNQEAFHSISTKPGDANSIYFRGFKHPSCLYKYVNENFSLQVPQSRTFADIRGCTKTSSAYRCTSSESNAIGWWNYYMDAYKNERFDGCRVDGPSGTTDASVCPYKFK